MRAGEEQTGQDSTTTNGEQLEQGLDHFSTVPLDISAKIFSYCSPHERICTFSRVSKFFRRTVRERIFPVMLIEKDIEGLPSLPMFEGKVVNMSNVYHAVHQALPHYTNRIKTSEWVIAAFLGDYDKLVELLGDDIMTTKDQYDMGVLHFAALGGQSELIKKLTDIHGVECLLKEEQANNSVLFYAVMGKQLHTVIMMLQDYKIDLYEAKHTTLPCYGELKNWNLTDRDLLALSQVMINDEDCRASADAWLSDTQNYSLASLYERLPKICESLTPDFDKDYDLTDSDNLEKLTLFTTRKIISELMTNHIEFLTHLVFLKDHQQSLQQYSAMAM